MHADHFAALFLFDFKAMRSTQYLPDEIKKTIAFKLTVYILPGIMFALITIIVLVPPSKPKQGILQGHIRTDIRATSTLVAEPLSPKQKLVELQLIPDSDYQLKIPAGEYHLKLKQENLRSPQLPRTLTIAPDSSAIFDITIE